MPNYPSPGVYIERKAYYPSALELQTRGLVGFAGITQRGPLNLATRVRNLDEYKDHFGAMIPYGFLPWAVQGYFENGGKECLVVRVAHMDDQEPGNNAAPSHLTLSDAEQQPRFEFQATEEGAWGNFINLSLVPIEDGNKSFHLFLNYFKTQEQFLNLSLDPQNPNFASRVINRQSRWIRLQVLPAAEGKIPSLTSIENVCLENGRNGLVGIEAGDFIGRIKPDGTGTGLQALGREQEVTLLAVPDAVNHLLFGAEKYEPFAEAIQKNMLLLCENHPLRFCILDTPASVGHDNISQWRSRFDTTRAAMYFPWLRMIDPESGKIINQPPCGHLAGIYSRLDRETKMLKHPANEPVRGSIGTTFEIDDTFQEFLNPRGINAIRVLRGQGIRVWGARTLSSNPELRYINTRRLLSYIEQTLSEGMQWVVFENNQEDLWKTVIRSTTAFLLELWRTGYLAGMTPEEAFYVKCDEETNPAHARAAGFLTVEIGLAMAKPAEYIIVKIKEKAKEE